MSNLTFKGFGVIDATKTGFDETELENSYIYFIKTDSKGESGYI